jgi:diaminohydroxyphosphoribosylaminopyrimidine deaminase/5-amino-6-(5-phosphoribosylamino)uracil reductase
MATKELINQAMSLAIKKSLAKKGFTSPNPWVGAVLIPKGAKTIKETFLGLTQPPGSNHAEVEAIKKAGRLAKGATLVVTLEPCSHWGRTPPCCDAIISAGIKTVVIGISDPDKRVNGNGIKSLKEAGINVVVGQNSHQVTNCLKEYLFFKKFGRPFVTLKLGCSIDGKIATSTGQSKWITNELSRFDVQKLRFKTDAILVGKNTYLTDNPSLSARSKSGKILKEPFRIVLGAPLKEDKRFYFFSGDLNSLMKELKNRGVMMLLVEGGAKVAYSFYKANLIDRYIFYFAPIVLGQDGLPAFAGKGPTELKKALKLELVELKKLGNDVKIVMERPI